MRIDMDKSSFLGMLDFGNWQDKDSASGVKAKAVEEGSSEGEPFLLNPEDTFEPLVIEDDIPIEEIDDWEEIVDHSTDEEVFEEGISSDLDDEELSDEELAAFFGGEEIGPDESETEEFTSFDPMDVTEEDPNEGMDLDLDESAGLYTHNENTSDLPVVPDPLDRVEETNSDTEFDMDSDEEESEEDEFGMDSNEEEDSEDDEFDMDSDDEDEFDMDSEDEDEFDMDSEDEEDSEDDDFDMDSEEEEESDDDFDMDSDEEESEDIEYDMDSEDDEEFDMDSEDDEEAFDMDSEDDDDFDMDSEEEDSEEDNSAFNMDSEDEEDMDSVEDDSVFDMDSEDEDDLALNNVSDNDDSDKVVVESPSVSEENINSGLDTQNSSEEFNPHTFKGKSFTPSPSKGKAASTENPSTDLDKSSVIHHLGMRLDEFLRKNPEIRSEKDVLGYYDKADIETLVKNGTIFKKKGVLKL